MNQVLEAKRAGRTAAVMGACWCLGLLALYLVNTAVFHHRSFMLLPVLALLAIYLLVGGGVQWMTGKGGIRPLRRTMRFTILVQVAALLVLALIQHFATGYWESLK